MSTEELSTERRVYLLSTMTNRDEAGRHFTERYAGDVLDDLESAGLIEITRPVHQPTGVGYSHEYWSLEVTPAGVALVDAYPEYWDTTA